MGARFAVGSGAVGVVVVILFEIRFREGVRVGSGSAVVVAVLVVVEMFLDEACLCWCKEVVEGLCLKRDEFFCGRKGKLLVVMKEFNPHVVNFLLRH